MKKTVIVYGKNNGIYKTALKHLSQIILDCTMKYPVCTYYSDFKEEENARYIFIGTKENNPYIKEHSDSSLSHPEEYFMKIYSDNIIIEGYDDAGVLYGCIDFYNKYILLQKNTHDHSNYFKNIFEEALPDFEFSSHPSIKMRGLWTWGHVIYDYKGYIDNLVRLKMNTLIIWNDFVPANAEDMISYAHDSNIKIFWGFPWGWDTACAEIDLENLEQYTKDIISNYEKNYAHLNGDGIYFQSFTELHVDNINGILIAEAVTDFVNKTASKLLEKYPDLQLQFGLHATSVKEHLNHMKNVDPRIRIVWEDCGAFPFHYIPEKIENFQSTSDFTEQILSLREDKEKFGAVLKGFTCLDWGSFEHQEGSFWLGTASPQRLRNRMIRKEQIWHYIQAYWLRNADKAYEMIQFMKDKSNGDICLTALVEDSMFENKLYYPVALFGKMLWDCNLDLKDLICETALSEYIEFA